ncbi:MAG: GIY-YIG nuclease family protein [Candidatus Levybacteria bacterium]|nr:GIY-YIG nuclease family protein [Candidatus Levybacteria bacterium]
MHYVYILSSRVRSYFYTGCTQDLKIRFIEHNAGKVTSTKPYLPFDLIYYEACVEREDAYKREKYLKSRLGKTYLRKRLKNWYTNRA